jgi:hypothetical protein
MSVNDYVEFPSVSTWLTTVQNSDGDVWTVWTRGGGSDGARSGLYVIGRRIAN